MDKTSFWIGCEKIQQAIFIYVKKPLLFIDFKNRDYITSIKTISIRRYNIPPIIILVYINILEKQVKNNLLNNIYFAISPTSYLNNDITLAQLKHFEYYSRKSQLRVQRFLIIDNFRLHLNSSSTTMLKLIKSNSFNCYLILHILISLQI